MTSSISKQVKQDCLARALKAADWFVNSRYQGDHRFDANTGRCLYYYFMPERRSLPGINWSHGRALFVLTEACKISGDGKYLEAARGYGCFIRALQQLDPNRPVSHGVFAEENPTCTYAGILDGAQAASGLLMLYRVTGEEGWLRGGRAFCDWLVRNWRPGTALPARVRFDPDTVESDPGWLNKCMHHGSAIPLWHLYSITGEGRYVPPLLDAADRILRCQRPEGPFNFVESTEGVEPPKSNHHEGYGAGDERFIIRNDDGIVTVVLAAYKVTGESKYLDAMVRYADWITAQEEMPVRPFVAFPVQANNAWDTGLVAGKDYSGWILRHLEARSFTLQVAGTGDPRADGGFRGEDEEGNAGIYGGEGTDYVLTRGTCYQAGLLFRLSGRGTGAGFSVFGLDRPK